MAPSLLNSIRMPLTNKNVTSKQSHDAALVKEPSKPLHHSQIPRLKPSQDVTSRPLASRIPSSVPRLADARHAQEASRNVLSTPKKRAVPLEDVHVRNAPAYSPSKRSRSSRSGTGSSAAEPSTGTTTSLANDLSGVKVADPSKASASLRPILRQPSALTAKPTTTRIDKNPRVTEQEKAARERQAYQEKKIWRHKFKKAFPSFIFYFDSFDQAVVKDLTAIIQQLGGSVDQFFSRNITHMITTRLVPAVDRPDGEGKENTPKALQPKDQAKEGLRKPVRPPNSKSRLSPSKTSTKHNRNRNLPLYSERNPFDDSGPPATGSNDILFKAQRFGMKVWRHEKLMTILKMLTDEPVAPTAQAGKQDLSQMLEQEKLFGTHERDPNATRGDYHYFKKSNFYLLVEDATMEHRPVMCTEFEYGRHHQQDGEEPPWPVLYGDLEGRCPFTKYEVSQHHRNRLTRGNNSHQTLRRVVSLNNMAKRNAGPPSPRPSNDGFQETRTNAYPMASGNSVSITSNIASTTSTAFTEQAAGLAVGLPQNRRVAELGRRMHTPLLYSPTTRLPASPASIVPNSAGSGLGISGDVGSGSGSSTAAGATHATGAAEHSRGAVVRRMLGMTEHDGKQPSSIIQGMRRSVSTSAVRPSRSQEKKPGYCENCRIKYDHFDSHILSRKHRKFATEDANFVEIDQLILRVQRPMIPDYNSMSDEGEETSIPEAGYYQDGTLSPWQDYVVEDDEQDAVPENSEESSIEDDCGQVRDADLEDQAHFDYDAQAGFNEARHTPSPFTQRRAATPFCDEFNNA